MFVVKVAPISKGISKEELTYFSSNSFLPGVIVRVPLRSKEVSALVISSEEAKDSKAEIKKADFALKKISKSSSQITFNVEFIKAIQRTADGIGSTTGALLNTLIPNKILEYGGGINPHKKNKKRRSIKGETLIIQADNDERMTQYKNIVRESFARKESVFICVPSIQIGGKIVKAIGRGLDSYIYEFNSSNSKKAMLEKWKSATEMSHPVVIIGTAQFLSIPRNDIETIILEEENSPSYKSQSRPFVDTRLFLENLIEETKGRLILGDTMLRIETLFRYKEREITELYPPKFRYTSGPKSRTIDMSKYKTQTGKKKFEIFSDEVRWILEKKVKENKENCFIYVGRKGLYPFTLCEDCGNYVVCKNCGKPTTVQKYKTKRLFVCNQCGKTRPTEERCANCDSWKLHAMGMGIDLVQEEIEKNYKDIVIFRIDRDSTSTHARAEKAADNFNKNHGAVLIGTSMALDYIDKVNNSAVVSIDSMFAIPDFRMSEKIFSLLLDIRSKTTDRMVVQIRNADTKLVEFAEKGNITDFYTEEINLRKNFAYPPFARFIKLTIIATHGKIEEEVSNLQQIFKGVRVELFPAIYTKSGSKRAINMLLRPTKNQERETLLKLKTLPQWIHVDVDPIMLL